MSFRIYGWKGITGGISGPTCEPGRPGSRVMFHGSCDEFDFLTEDGSVIYKLRSISLVDDTQEVVGSRELGEVEQLELVGVIGAFVRDHGF